MNDNIVQYLFKYANNPDPRYAVMLKGKWGCGKSFFIQNWIEQYKKKKMVVMLYLNQYMFHYMV